MIGNDIVDLNLAGKSNRWKGSRFLKKVFTPNEQNAILQSGNDRFNLVWRMWSMKESAYKVYIQQGHKPPCYAPSKIHCQIYSATTGIVRINDHLYRTISEVTNSYILSYCILEKEQTAITKCVKILGKPLSSVQRSCREKVLLDYAFLSGAKAENLKIEKCPRGIPRIMKNDEPENVSISMTHHGNYYAYAMII